MKHRHIELKPALLLKENVNLFLESPLKVPVLDLACGIGRNGIFLAQKGLDVVLCDRSAQALQEAGHLAQKKHVTVDLRQVDLELEGVNPLPVDAYRGIVVFSYLHRPLIGCIKKAIRQHGFLIYETFTVHQSSFGKPSNPNFLLKPGELFGWFRQWKIIHSFEGKLDNPPRFVAQLVCQKP